MNKGLRYFKKKDIQMAGWHRNGYSTSLILKEIQIKTTLRYHFKPIRLTVVKKTSNTKCWYEVDKEKKNPSVLLVGI